MTESTTEKNPPLKSLVSGSESIKKPGWVLLILGVIYPAGVIIFEVITGFCAETFFNPLPTVFHVALVALVPLSNGILWWQLRHNQWQNFSALMWMATMAMGVAGFYTLIFAPITLIALLAIVAFGMVLLPLAPARTNHSAKWY